ncbi:MAG: transketolase [Sedimentisphaerales bacterium]|nr:transketolase [Sedimentisphaerales bacterium]
MSEPVRVKGLTGLDELCIDTIRFLAADAVQKAKSGHPGMPMGLAPAAYTLWMRHLKFNPANPKWFNRDRFILSGGHGCMLLYSLLFLTGYDMSLDDLKNFRQWGSKTPGHPEYHPDLGIEATTGPLGQGISNAVGMAIAQKYLANYFNREGFPVVDYKIYVACGDGDLEEGISSETSSLAGHLVLDNLIVIYDDNHISIDGPTELSFTEDRAKRYKAYGWNVIEVPGDGNDMAAFEKALKKAKRTKGKPTLIKLRTHIAFGAPTKHDTAEAHGAPLGEDEIKATKKIFGWDPQMSFNVPEHVLPNTRTAIDRGKKAEAKWNHLFKKYAEAYRELAQQFQDALVGKITVDIDSLLPKFDPVKDGKPNAVSTRSASGKTLDALMPKMPFILGGSADLTPSNNTRWKDVKDFQPNSRDGRYIRFGVREHGMGAILSGISINGLTRAFGGTFLTFSDYMRGAVRVSAIAKYPTIFVWTHDSIGVGEDGPTHQPVEHFAALRAIPNMLVIRPADANETAQAWKFILQYNAGPVALLLTRQNLPVFDQAKYAPATNLPKGAYTLISGAQPEVLLLATGSEVAIAIDAYNKLAAEGIKTRVVSMPCWELFEKQSQDYRDSVLPPIVKARVGVEAAVELGWHKWLGIDGAFVGMHSFGHSAPYKVCFEKFGITADAVVSAAKNVLGR